MTVFGNRRSFSSFPRSVLTFDQALALPTTIYDSVKAQLMQKKQQTFDERRKQLVSMVTNAKDEQQTHTIRFLSIFL